jgi:hypothetical protein
VFVPADYIDSTATDFVSFYALTVSGQPKLVFTVRKGRFVGAREV